MCFGSGGSDKTSSAVPTNGPRTMGGPADRRPPPDPMATDKSESGLLTESATKPRPSVLGAQ